MQWQGMLSEPNALQEESEVEEKSPVVHDNRLSTTNTTSSPSRRAEIAPDVDGSKSGGVASVEPSVPDVMQMLLGTQTPPPESPKAVDSGNAVAPRVENGQAHGGDTDPAAQIGSAVLRDQSEVEEKSDVVHETRQSSPNMNTSTNTHLWDLGSPMHVDGGNSNHSKPNVQMPPLEDGQGHFLDETEAAQYFKAAEEEAKMIQCERYPLSLRGVHGQRSGSANMSAPRAQGQRSGSGRRSGRGNQSSSRVHGQKSSSGRRSGSGRKSRSGNRSTARVHVQPRGYGYNYRHHEGVISYMVSNDPRAKKNARNRRTKSGKPFPRLPLRDTRESEQH